MLHGGAQMLGKHLGDPRGLHGGGEAEQGLARRGFAQIGGNEISGVGHHAFAHELALALIGEIALGLAGSAAFGELIDEAGHEAAQQGFVVFSWAGGCGITVVEALLVGGLQDLLAGLLYLAGDLGVDAVAAAALKAEAVRFGEVIGSHQRDEIRVRAVLEHLAGGFGLRIIAIQPSEQIATTDQRGAQGGIGNAATLAGLDHHARVARVHRQAQHLATDGRELGTEQRPEHREQTLSTHDGLRIGFVQPVKRSRLPDPERVQQQHDFGEVAALDLRRIAFLAALVADGGPQAMTSARRGASCTAFALIRTGPADRLQQQRADAALRIVTGHPGDAAVNDMADAVDGDAGLRDVGGDDHFAQRVRSKRAVLFLRFQFAMQRDAGHALPRSQPAQGIQRAIDLAAPRHEDEDVAGRLVMEDALDGLRRLHRDRSLVGELQIAHFHGITLPLGNEDRTLIQIRRHRLRIQRGRHHHHRQIRPVCLLQMFHQRQRDIAEQVPLVELIEDHCPDVLQCAIILKPSQQNALRDKANASPHARVVIKPNLIPDLSAELPLTFPSHPRRHRAGRHPPGLQHHDHLLPRDPRIQQHLRHLRRLPRACGGHQHQAIAALQRAQEVGVNFPNGERGGVRHEVGNGLT